VIHVRGELRTADAAAIWRQLHEATSALPTGGGTIDLAGARTVDGNVLSMLLQARAEAAQRGVTLELSGASERTEALLALVRDERGPARAPARSAEGMIAHTGRATLAVLGEAREVVTFLGSVVVACASALRSGRRSWVRDIAPLVERAGADAVPIVVLINFLVGFVMAFQSAKQLEMFGANTLVADLVSISMTRELAPLMTAIIVGGRSGAGFAAELGTMKVSEELDALRTMRMDPVRTLVLPRMIALVLATPVLALVADITGILGGMVVAATSLDVSPTTYLNAVRGALDVWDVGGGLIKSVAFAVVVALIACQQGFATSGGAQGVGKRATSTVVASLFAIVIVDALFTVLYRVLDV
jgi:phospholipid/cholesterol/gamma-HCH transport system permease protein